MADITFQSTTILELVSNLLKIKHEERYYGQFTDMISGSDTVRNSLKALPIAIDSIGSPTAVPVPWASQNLVNAILSPAFR